MFNIKEIRNGEIHFDVSLSTISHNVVNDRMVFKIKTDNSYIVAYE